MGMTNGPHQAGNASYPLAWNGTAATRLESYMTVPEYPSGLETEDDFSEITYYIWTDVFFGDESLGRMNQLVPQLILGSALDGSSGPPNFDPEWRTVHTTWVFGAHYFFEIWNPATNATDDHAAYGALFPANPGELLKTTFELSLPSPSDGAPKPSVSGDQRASDEGDSSSSSSSPAWTLTMSIVGDPKRKSVLRVSEPYMGMGKNWSTPSTSWLEPNFQNMCINACWELYGASDAGKLPASGAEYKMTIEQPLVSTGRREILPRATTATKESSASALRGGRRNEIEYSKSTENGSSQDNWKDSYYDFTTWEQDEGNGVCPSCTVSEVHTPRMQEVFVEIEVAGSATPRP